MLTDANHLPYLVFSTTFGHRRLSKPNGLTGLMMLNIPCPQGDSQITELRQRVSQIPYKQMFAQAVTELNEPDSIYWFTHDDEREIQQHNHRYQQESAPELVLTQF